MGALRVRQHCLEAPFELESLQFLWLAQMESSRPREFVLVECKTCEIGASCKLAVNFLARQSLKSPT